MDNLAERGVRAIAIARTRGTLAVVDDEWELLGLLTFLDPPRRDTKQTVVEAKRFSVAVKMITGKPHCIIKYYINYIRFFVLYCIVFYFITILVIHIIEYT